MQGQGKAKVSLTFALYQNDQMMRRETITQDIIKVGKDPKSHLRVDDELASRMHAVIEVASPEDITLIDLGNEPGTMVNGARINKCRVHAGDQIQIGGTRIILEHAEVAAVAAPAPQAGGFGAAFGSAPAPAPSQPAAPFGATMQGTGPMFAPAAPAYAASPAVANPFAVPTGPVGYGAANPFAGDPYAVPDNAPPGSYTYTLLKSGPDVSPDEVEISHLNSVEVMILWDTTVLHVQHLTPPRNFYVGEEEGKNFACDYFVPSEKLGTTRAPVVLADHGSVNFVILPRAKGTVEIPGQPKMTLEEAVRAGRTQPCAEL